MALTKIRINESSDNSATDYSDNFTFKKTCVCVSDFRIESSVEEENSRKSQTWASVTTQLNIIQRFMESTIQLASMANVSVKLH